MLAVALLALLLYAVTAPHTVTLEDDAIFIGALHFFGIPIPPGYPLYTLLGGIFYHLLPLGAPAYKAHLFSAVTGAGAVAAVYAVTALLLPGRLAALAAAAAFATSRAFWSQAIIAEVYTLNALLFFLFVALLLHALAQQRQGIPWGAAVVCGLGLANHYPLFILAASGIGLAVLLLWRNRLRTLAAGSVVALASAAPFYLWMVWRSHHEMPLHFYGSALDTWGKFAFYLLRRGYAAGDNDPDVTWTDRLHMAEFLADETLMQFTWLGAALAAGGIIALLRQQRVLAAGLLLSVLATSPLLIVIRSIAATYVHLAIFSVYHLTSYGIMAIALAAGIHTLAGRCGKWRGGVTAALAVAVVLANLVTHWHSNNRHHATWAEDLAMAKLTSVDTNAILFTQGDLDLPIGYLRYVRGVRPDVTVLDANGLLYGNFYLPHLNVADDHPFPSDEEADIILQRFIAGTVRPIFFPPDLLERFESAQRGSDMLGFHRRLSHQPQRRVYIAAEVLAWLQNHLRHPIPHTDRWTYVQQRITVVEVVSAALSAHWSGHPLTPAWHEAIALARQQNLPIDTVMTEHELRTGQLSAAQVKARLHRCAMPDAVLQQEIEIDEVMRTYTFASLCAQLEEYAAAQEQSGAGGGN